MATGSAIDYSALVNYAGFDDFKVACQEAGRLTADNLKLNGFRELTWSRGESAYVMQSPWGGVYFAHVEEGLGTKVIPADRMAERIRELSLQQEIAAKMQELLGRSFYKEVAGCNVAMVINDLITSGASPLSFMQHLAVASDDWFKDKERVANLIEGTRLACDIAESAWGGGETPVLRNIVVPGSALLSGSATGFIDSQRKLINPANIKDGDAIILFGSSGPHANGYTMLWDVVAPRLSDGYLTIVPGDGRTFGEVILARTTIYSRLIKACLNAGVHIHYAVNITGHGWCKLMRATQPFSYIINKLPKQQPIFDFIQQVNPISDKKMYKTFNMGAGFAIYISRGDIKKVLHVSEKTDPSVEVINGGYIQKSWERSVIIKPKSIKFGPEDLVIR